MRGQTHPTIPSVHVPHGFKPHDGNSFRPADCQGDNLVLLRSGRESRAGRACIFWVWDSRSQFSNDIVGYVPNQPDITKLTSSVG
jgi:hypothetical protein